MADGPVVVDSSASNSKLQAFVQRRWHYFVLAGSLIVTATLHVRDSTHEKAKAVKEAIENRSNFAELRELNQQTFDGLGELRDKMEKPPESGLAVEESGVANYVAKMTILIHDTDAALNFDKEIVGILPEVESRYRQSLDDIANQVELQSQQTLIAVNGNRVVAVDPAARMDKVSAILNKLLSIRKNIQQDVEERSDYYDRISSLFGIISYFLIALGLSLSLIGQRAGKPGEFPDIHI